MKISCQFFGLQTIPKYTERICYVRTDKILQNENCNATSAKYK